MNELDSTYHQKKFKKNVDYYHFDIYLYHWWYGKF